MSFAIGDTVKPIPPWDQEANNFAYGKHPALPSGRVTSTEPWGKGQVIKIEGNAGSWLAGCFEKVTTE